jgi:hypothetical protein
VFVFQEEKRIDLGHSGPGSNDGATGANQGELVQRRVAKDGDVDLPPGLTVIFRDHMPRTEAADVEGHQGAGRGHRLAADQARFDVHPAVECSVDDVDPRSWTHRSEEAAGIQPVEPRLPRRVERPGVSRVIESHQIRMGVDEVWCVQLA